MKEEKVLALWQNNLKNLQKLQIFCCFMEKLKKNTKMQVRCDTLFQDAFIAGLAF